MTTVYIKIPASCARCKICIQGLCLRVLGEWSPIVKLGVALGRDGEINMASVTGSHSRHAAASTAPNQVPQHFAMHAATFILEHTRD